MYEAAVGDVENTTRIVKVPAVVIALASKMSSRGLPSQQALLELDCVDQVDILTATTPADFDLADVAHPHVFSTLQDWFNRVTMRDLDDVRQVACALSHIRAWTLCAESNTPLLIAEDDVHTHKAQLLRNQVALARVPNDAHVLSLLNLTGGFSTGFVTNLCQSPFKVTKVHQEFSGLQCYLLQPDGARLLLKYAMPVTMHIDRYMSDCMYAGLNVYRCGRSSVAFIAAPSTLSHAPKITWTLVFVSGAVVGVLLIVCMSLGVKIHKMNKTPTTAK